MSFTAVLLRQTFTYSEYLVAASLCCLAWVKCFGPPSTNLSLESCWGFGLNPHPPTPTPPNRIDGTDSNFQLFRICHIFQLKFRYLQFVVLIPKLQECFCADGFAFSPFIEILLFHCRTSFASKKFPLCFPFKHTTLTAAQYEE